MSPDYISLGVEVRVNIIAIDDPWIICLGYFHYNFFRTVFNYSIAQKKSALRRFNNHVNQA